MALEEKNSSLPPLQRRYLIKALEQINKLTGLTRDLRDFPSRDALVFGVVCIKDLLQQAADDLDSTVAAKNLRLVQDTPGGTLCTIGDSEKLGVALRGFLSAAIEAAGRGGTVRVEAGADAEQIFLRLSATGDAATMSRPRPVELAAACRFWRLHGGSVTVNFAAVDGDVVTGELPVVRPFEC